MAENKADSSVLILRQVIAILAFVLAFVAAIFAVSVHSINSSNAANMALINDRFDRVEARIDERFDGLEAKVGVNTRFTAAFEGKQILTWGSSTSS